MDSIKVMVVEDNEIDMTVITSALEAAGISYYAVNKSTEALEVALRYKPSIAILDMNMPELNGKEVQEQLNTHPETEGIKIIFLSAADSVDDVVFGLNVQASAYFRKGVKIGQIISSINAIDSTAKIRTSIDQFASQNRQLASKYSTICANSEGDKSCGVA